jgi:hypothetical protein
VRQVIPTIFKLNAKFFEAKYDRSNEPDVLALLKFPGDAAYPLLPPVFFPDGVRNITKLFCNELLLQVSTITS